MTAPPGGAGTLGNNMPTEDAGTTWVELDAEGRYVDADGAALTAYGLSADELRAHSVGDFAPRGLGGLRGQPPPRRRGGSRADRVWPPRGRASGALRRRLRAARPGPDPSRAVP